MGSCPVFFARRARLFTGLCAMLGLMAGCAGVPPVAVPQRSSSPEEIVGERAQERWEALLAGNLGKAYSFLSPASRQINSLDSYSSSVRVGFWKKARVERVTCPEADLCEVHLVVEYVRGSAISTPLLESWAQSGGQWWYVLK
jgi:hypothetical protein